MANHPGLKKHPDNKVRWYKDLAFMLGLLMGAVGMFIVWMLTLII